MVHVNNSGNNFYLKAIYEIKANHSLNGITSKPDFDRTSMSTASSNSNPTVKKPMSAQKAVIWGPWKGPRDMLQATERPARARRRLTSSLSRGWMLKADKRGRTKRITEANIGCFFSYLMPVPRLVEGVKEKEKTQHAQEN